jgi:predicted flap endonuclease-1-like 5' DNA nuclease
MNQNLTIAVIVVIAIALALILLTRSRNKPSADTSPPPKSLHTHSEPNGVIDGGAAAFEDVASQFVGIDAHPDLAGPPDDLTIIKGLGPKAAAQLKLLGVTRYAQLAALDTAQIQALDEQMGVFRGRLERDRWPEQARYLSRGDTATFEKEFGKLG